MPHSGSREEAVERLKSGVLDVLILGGGINGAGIARELALRVKEAGAALEIGLAEQHHFASGTSGRNSQLIHGGLRYLKSLQFHLVREALRERALLLELAPQFVEPLPFLMPVYGRWRRLYYGAGLALYDLLAGGANIGRHRSLSRQEVERLEPKLAAGGLCRGEVFHDCRIHSARFVLANLFEAVENGVSAANYLRAEGWEREGGHWRVRATDTLSGEIVEIRARKLVDATGPWGRTGSLRLVRGSHLVFPRLNTSDHAIAWFDEAGRILFVIPWGEQGQLSLVGTTDVDHQGGPDDVRITAGEADYLLGVVKRLFPSEAARPIAAFSALRPLLRNESVSATRASREHRIWNSGDGILHVAGGKYTTYRLMSEQATDLIAREIAPPLARLRPSRHARFEVASVPAARPARIAFAVHHEMARRLGDLLFVSTYWGYEQQWERGSLEPYAREMGSLLGWDQRRIEQEIELVLWQTALPERC